MKSRAFVVFALALGVSSLAGAQTVLPGCQATGFGEDGCQKAADLFAYMAPQLGTLMAGGNATLGQGGTLGGLPHFRISVRANAMRAGLPDIGAVPLTVGPARQDNYPVNDQYVALPQVDAAIGVFKGIPLGVTNVGGIDLLVSASYVPSFENETIKVASGKTQFGLGARLGLLQESLVIPGISVTVLRRDLPSIDLSGTATGDTLSVKDLKVKTTAWRLVASKSLFLLNLAAGVGRDVYDSRATVRTSLTSATSPIAQNMKRTNYFVDATLNFPFFKIIGEIGQVSGGKVSTYNTFSQDADKSRVYASAGFRIGL